MIIPSAKRSSDVSAEKSQSPTIGSASAASSPSDSRASIRPVQQDTLLWLNPAQKNLASKRQENAIKLSLPYVYAAQKLGESIYHLDGAMAEDISSDAKLSAKFFNENGQQWSPDDTKTTFFCRAPGASRDVRIGTVGELEAKGLNPPLISSLFDFGGLKDDLSDESEDAMTTADRNRALFFVFYSTGLILPQSAAIAHEIAKGAPSSRLNEAILTEMVYSAGSDMFFLEAGLKLGINPDQRSKEAGCRPISWAIAKGNKKAVQRLLPLTADPGADRDFFSDPWTMPKDQKLLDLILKYSDLNGKKGSR